MKSYNIDKYLLNKTFIKIAIETVCKNKKKKKGKSNKNYYEAQKILKNIDYYIDDLYKQLLGFELKYCQNKEVDYLFNPSCKNHFKTQDGSRRKTRKITSAPLYPDQMVHELFISLLYPIIKPTLYEYSCGSIKGKGIHYGVNKIKKVIKKHNDYKPSNIKYVFKGDIKKCYASFQHQYIKNIIGKRLKGKLAYQLFSSIVNVYHDKIINGKKYGIPIGFATSQYICNICLTPLDNFIKHKLKIKHYFRYMDDIVCFSSNKKKLHNNVRQIEKFLNAIGMRLKENWQVFRFDYIDKNGIRKGRDLDFLGYRFFRDKTILRKDLSLRIKRQTKRIYKKDEYNINMCKSFISRMGWLKHCDAGYFMNKYVRPFVDIGEVKKFISNFDKGVIKDVF